MKMKKLFMSGAALLSVMFLAGCKEDARALEKKAVARWQAVIDKDFEKAYDYFSPGYKQIEDLDVYRLRIMKAQIKIQWTDVEFDKLSCDSEVVCDVHLKVTYDYSFPQKNMGELKQVKTPLKEKWLKNNGVWSYVPEMGK